MLLAAAAFGQESAKGPGQRTDVEVVSFNWKYSGYAKVDVVNSEMRENSPGDYSVKRGSAFGFKYTATALIKNNSQKNIQIVEWHYVFTDPDGKELKRFKVKSKQQIQPGQTVSFSRAFFVDTNKNLQSLNSAKQQVIVANVEFERD
jgi:uncharacterized protein affecting Mg2+/Co2+ transport